MAESEDHPQTNSPRTNESTASVGEKSRANIKLPEDGATNEETPCSPTLDQSQTPVSCAVESEGIATDDNNLKSSTDSADSLTVSASEVSVEETRSGDVEVEMEMTDSDTNDSQSRGSAQKETQGV